jgi:hypothetical protein
MEINMIDPMVEHEAKLAFIERMKNKYDYLAFKQFCIESGFEVMSFPIYAGLIEPSVPSTINNPHVAMLGDSRGLGDTIAKITHATGLDQLATMYTQITGQPCGCSDRQEALNKLVPYGIKETV